MAKDIVRVLAEEHTALRGMAQMLRARSESRPQLFNQFARALGAHVTVMDEVVIPSLKQFGWRGVSSALLTGHSALKRSLAEWLAQRRHSNAFRQRLMQLLSELESQLEMEDRHLLPLLRQALDAPQRLFLGIEAESQRAQMMGDSRGPQAIEAAPAADELLEEAHVVLGSLPTQDRDAALG